MHVFEDQNELTQHIIFFWSYYNIENTYRNKIGHHFGQNLTKTRISAPFES